MSGRSAAEKWAQEAGKADGRGFAPFQLENRRIKLGAGEKGQHDCSEARQKLHPGFIGAEHGRSDHRTDDELCDGSDHNFR